MGFKIKTPVTSQDQFLQSLDDRNALSYHRFGVSLNNIKRSIIINDFISITKNFIKQFNCVALIKHVPACIAYDNRLSFNSSGNSGLSTAGSGDVLSGMIASFIAQKITGS